MDTLLHQALDAMAGFVVVNKEKEVKYVNQEFASMLGMEPEALIGKRTAEFILNDVLQEAMLSGRKLSKIIVPLLPYGKKHHITVLCNIMPLFGDGKLIGAVITHIMDRRKERLLEKALTEEFLNNEKKARRIRHAVKQFMDSEDATDWIVGKSEAIKDIKQLIRNSSQSNLSILIIGETGVGKEIFAKVIHMLNNDTLQNFVYINCADIKEEWWDTEFFHYLTEPYMADSMQANPYPEFFQNGTLFFDEVTEMPKSLQSKLLLILQNKERKEEEAEKKEFRVICSSDEDIEQLINEGTFRRDLYYRINTIEFTIPPLRKRKEDISKLSKYFLDRINYENDFSVEGISPDVLDLFMYYDWPGNVLELKHVLERLAIINPTGTLKLKDCEFIKQKIGRTTKNCETFVAESLSSQRIEIEKKAIISALQETNYNKTKAAQLLNIDRSALYKKMKRYHLKDEKRTN